MKITMSALLTALLLAGCAQSHNPSTGVSGMKTSVAQQSVQVQLSRTELAPALYELAYSTKQQAVFVASAGDRELGNPKSKIYRLHPDTLEIEAEVELQYAGLGVFLDDEANRLYVGNAFDAAVTVIDTQLNQVIGVVRLAEKIHTAGFDGKPTERYPHNLRELVVDKKNNRLFAPGIWINDSALYVMRTDTLTVETVIPDFGFGASGVTLDEARGKLYVSNMQGQLYTIDTQTLSVESVAEVQADQLLNLVFDKRTNRILAVDQGAENVNRVREKLAKLPYQQRGKGNRVVVINPEDGRIEKSIPTDTGPVNLALDEKNNRLVVTNRGSGTVTIYDRNNDDRLLQTIALSAHPNTPKIDNQLGTIFVTVKNSDTAPKGGNESVARILVP